MNSICRIVFVRHGTTAENSGPWNNQNGNWNMGEETPINDKGKAEAEEAKRNLSHFVFDAVITSNTKRAQETAQIISCNRDIQTESSLREIKMAFDGTSQHVSEADYIKMFKEYTGHTQEVLSSAELFRSSWHPNAETYEDYGKYFLNVIKKIALENIGKTVLVVGHSTGGKVLRGCITKGNVSFDNINDTKFKPGEWISLEFNQSTEKFTVIKL